MATYTVKPGDSWFRIAGILYGDQRMAGELQAMNAGIDVLQPGMKIKIPDKPAEGYVPYIAPGQMEAWVQQGLEMGWDVSAFDPQRYLELAEEQGFGVTQEFYDLLTTQGLIPGEAVPVFGLGTTGGPAEAPFTGRGPGGRFFRGGAPGPGPPPVPGVPPRTGRGPGGREYGAGAPGPGPPAARGIADLPEGAFGPQGRGPGGRTFGPRGRASPGQYAAARRREAGIARGFGPQRRAGDGRPPEMNDFQWNYWIQTGQRPPGYVGPLPGEAGVAGGAPEIVSPYPPAGRTDAELGPLEAVGEGLQPPPRGAAAGFGETLTPEQRAALEGEAMTWDWVATQVASGKRPTVIKGNAALALGWDDAFMISIGYVYNEDLDVWFYQGTGQLDITTGTGGYGGYSPYRPRPRGGGGGRGYGGGYYQPHLMGLINWRIGS